jgi:heme oxygenase
MTQLGVAHQRLRDATREAHRALEDDLDAIVQLTTIEGRRRLAPRYLDLHAAADAVYDRWLADAPGLDNPPRRRAPLIRADLRRLQVAPNPAPPPAPAVTSVAEALGFLYVMEGSTLGGRMILKAVAARAGETEGLGFMDPYGARTGEAWRDFLGVLEREVANDPERLDGAEAGAAAGFAYARACLCGAA